jgi:DNA repair exonuclease SbcCD ATPase subunit
MRIKVLGFKCHLEAEFIFVNNEMTLIKGASGSGKSSLLQAMFWALYGNMRSIYNNMRITKNLSVYLELPGITIFRQKNPEALSVTVVNNYAFVNPHFSQSSLIEKSEDLQKCANDTNDSHESKIYENTVAQSLIDSIFGSREVWKACSYIEQQSRCSLLSGSGGERLELLNALSFTGENPKEYISKINEKLKEVTNLFITNQAIFVTEVELYTISLNERTITYNLNGSELDRLKSEIGTLETNEKILAEECCNFERSKGTLDYMTNVLQRLETDLIAKDKMLIFTSKGEKETLGKEEGQVIEVVIPSELYITTPYPILEEKPLIPFEEYSNIKSELTKKIHSLASSLSNLEKHEKEQLRLEKVLQDTQNKILTIPDIQNLINVPISSEEIWNVAKIEKERIRFEKECSLLKIPYEELAISNSLASLTNTLLTYTSLEKQLGNYSKLVTIEKNIATLKIAINASNKDNKDKIRELDKHLDKHLEKLSNEKEEKALLISELKKGLELLNCPNCSTSLRYKNGTLMLGERDPVAPTELLRAEKEYKEILDLLNSFRSLITLEENAKMYAMSSKEREALEDYIKNKCSIQIPTLSSTISKLSTVSYIPLPKLSSSILTDIHNFQKAYAEHAKFISSVSTSTYNRNEIQMEQRKYESLLKENEDKYRFEQDRVLRNQDKIREHQKKESERLKEISKWEEKKRLQREKMALFERERKLRIEKLEKLKLEKEQLELEISKKKEEIQTLSSQINFFVKEKHAKIKKELEEKKKIVEETAYGNKIIERGKQLEEKRNKLVEISKDVEILTRLKLKAAEVECKQLEDTVENINTVLETTLPIFFNEPISLKLLLYKKVKKTVKPMLNLEICYKGCKYDNINNLSGGEGDRISLALLLALNTVSNSPILLLDECVASLDPELKESCLTAIKTIPNKTVICVDHDDSLEGFYDSVVSLS